MFPFCSIARLLSSQFKLRKCLYRLKYDKQANGGIDMDQIKGRNHFEATARFNSFSSISFTFFDKISTVYLFLKVSKQFLDTEE